MIKMKVLRLVIAFGLLASCYAAEDDGGDEHQCHDLYEYIATKKGQVTSPFYGKRDEYHNGLWCEYRIRSPRGTRIKITFKVLDLQPSSGCVQDRLVVYGKSKQSVLGIFCGSELPKPILSSEGENEIRLLFQTDFMAGGQGFVVEYESGRNLSLCQPGFTLCANRNCYENSKKCDGNDDCGDGTDEEDCGFPIVTSPSECGNTPILPKTYESTDRMVGGENVIPHSWPWQASLQTAFSEPNGHFCGGTLLNAQWVLSAGHCVAGFSNPNQLKIHLGQHSKYKKSKYEQIRKAIKIISYPDLEFDNLRRFSFTDDITLIKLNAPVKFNDGVQPGCLPSLGFKPPPKTKCYVTGWGETRGTGGSDVLKQSEQIIQSQEECTHNEQTQICLYNYNNNPCHGDSGGPLSCKLGGKWYVFGAASFVTTTNFMSGLCTGEGSRTVYASSADKIEWINTIINKYS